ncbi:hypothetical protein JB92DRAFT_3052420 [Gautieria morchelliformis]|nr:hypothetical protein JB92DRAFT_3052420 [Gautieria morchelliformis]
MHTPTSQQAGESLAPPDAASSEHPATSLLSPLTVDDAFAQFLVQTPRPDADTYANGMEKLKRFDQGMDPERAGRVPEEAKRADVGGVEKSETRHVRSRPPTPSRSSTIAPPGTQAAVRRTLPPRTVSRPASAAPKSTVSPSPPPSLQRSATMLPNSRKLVKEDPRPSSAPGSDFPRENGKNGHYKISHARGYSVSVGRVNGAGMMVSRRGDAPEQHAEYVQVTGGGTPPSLVSTSRSPSKPLVPTRSSLRRPSTSSMSGFRAETNTAPAAAAVPRVHGTKIAREWQGES